VDVVPAPDEVEGMTTYRLSAAAVEAQRLLVEQRAENAEQN
jgi:hypothetical protein